MRLLIVDNFDSFTYNLVHYFEEIVDQVDVVTNLQVDLNQLASYDALVLSPGPGLPDTSGRLMAVVAYCDSKKIPVLGVCLGMQALAQYYGNELYNQQQIKHGIQEEINLLNDSMLFKGLPESIQVGLYHSWAVRLTALNSFNVSACSRHGIIMAIENVDRLQFAVQFHPESIMTPNGKQILRNFVEAINFHKTMRS